MDFQHLIETHAAQLGARLYYIESVLDSRSDVDMRTLHVPQPTNRLLYWTAMHELGHIATTRPMFMPSDREITETEATAWVWALDHADFPIAGDSDLVTSIAAGMASYFTASGPVDHPDVRRVVEVVGPSVDWPNLPFSFSAYEAPYNARVWADEWRLLQGR